MMKAYRLFFGAVFYPKENTKMAGVHHEQSICGRG